MLVSHKPHDRVIKEIKEEYEEVKVSDLVTSSIANAPYDCFLKLTLVHVKKTKKAKQLSM